MTRRYWTVADLRKLSRLYPRMTAPALAKAFRRTRSSIDNKAVKLQLRKSAAFLAGPDCRFQRGMVPWNRGVTGYMGANRTSFRKGDMPQTWRPIGSERVTRDGTLERKVRNPDRWQPVKDILWRAKHGRIPRGRFVVHKNRDRDDFRMRNLELVSRAENMRRNTIYRYPAALVRVMKLRAKLDRTIEAESEKQNRGSSQSPVRGNREGEGRRHAAGSRKGRRRTGASHHQQLQGRNRLPQGDGRSQGDRFHRGRAFDSVSAGAR